MPEREKIQKIDDQWQALQPGWGRKNHEGERKMLYDILQPAEDIELLYSCGFETRNVAWGGRHDRGIVVATGRRIILLNRGRLSKNRFSMTYQEIDEITGPEPGMVRLWGSGSRGDADSELKVFDLDLQLAANEFSRFVRGRLLSDEESVAAAFPSVLEPGEQVRHWAHCAGGQETIFYTPARHYGGGNRSPESWSISWGGLPAIAVATEGRILLINVSVDADILLRETTREEVVASCPHGTIQVVEHTEDQVVRFVDLMGQVYTARFRREADASPFVDIVREHEAAAQQASAIDGQAVLAQHDRVGSGESPDKGFVARLQSLSEATQAARSKSQESDAVPHSSQTVSSKEARLFRNWVERSPDRFDLDTRKNERERLLNILQDDEDIERLVEGQYKADVKGSDSHDVVVAATDRRLLFVYNGVFGEHVNEMPYSDIGAVEFKKGFLSGRITIAGRPGVNGYIVNYVETDGVEEFVSCVQSHL